MKINKKIICTGCKGSGSNNPNGTKTVFFFFSFLTFLVTDTKCKSCNGQGRKMKAIRQGNTIYQTQMGIFPFLNRTFSDPFFQIPSFSKT